MKRGTSPSIFSPIVTQTADDRLESWVNHSVNAKLLAWQRESISTGMLAEMQQALRTMLFRWGYLRTALKKVTDCMTGYQWSILPYVAKKENEPTPEAQQHAEIVDDAIYAHPAIHRGRWELDFSALLKQIGTALYRGTYVAEIDWEHDPAANIIVPRRYRTIPPAYYGWTVQNNEPDELVLYPDGCTDTSRYMPFPDDKFIVALGETVGDHPIFSAALVSLLPWYIAAEFGLKEALNFINRFAQPIRVARYGNKQQQDAATEMLKKMGNATWLVAPKTLELEIINANQGGSGASPHLALIQAAKNEVDLVIGGQKLASGTSDTGSNSRALGEVHNEVRKEVVEAMADFVKGILNTQLVPTILRLNLGELPEHLPSIEFADPNGHADEATLNFVLRVVETIPVAKQWPYEQLNIPMPAADAELFTPVGSMAYGSDEENPWEEEPETPLEEEPVEQDVKNEQKNIPAET